MYDDDNDYESNADRALRERLEQLEAENAKLRSQASAAPADPYAALNAALDAIPEFVPGGDGHLIVNPDAPRLIGEAIRSAGGTVSGNDARYRGTP